MAELKIKADSGGGTVSFKGPATTTSNAAVQLTLPVDDGTSGQYLKTDGSGALSWATVSSDVVDDTTPQLGGNLDVNGKDITGDAIDFHAADGQVMAKLHKTNSSEFYFNNSKKLEVTNTGISVTGSVTPSGGIYLGGTGGSNAINDYEEGTWTPTLTPGSGTTPIDSNYNTGQYTKIGRLVHVCGHFVLGTVSSPSGTLSLGGLPFATGNETEKSARCMMLVFSWTTESGTSAPYQGEHILQWALDEGQTENYLKAPSASTGDDASGTIANWYGNGADFYINGTYIV